MVCTKKLIEKQLLKDIDFNLINLDSVKTGLEQIDYIDEISFNDFILLLLLEVEVFAIDTENCYKNLVKSKENTIPDENNSELMIRLDENNKPICLKEVLMQFILMEHSFLGIDFLYTKFNTRFDVMNEIKNSDEDDIECLYYVLLGYKLCIDYYIECCNELKDIFEFPTKFQMFKINGDDTNE